MESAIDLKKRMRMDRNYVPPAIEAMEVEVEEGFAVSVAVNPNGAVNNFDTNGYGSQGGGSTMDF
jgi:hypothetical protein